ncbi:unnamed protein product [Vicia faba]|uniref:Pentatricopeptide repeat-containing protein n=1 Tax=Vicia faba TaxID=3906 RepID=A0AAV1ANH1_VICFA|nr:unnamed protein product [Vicia faba]
MNTILSIALRPHHRFIPILLKMITTQTKPLQNPITTTTTNPNNNNNNTVSKINNQTVKSNFSDLITLGGFLRSSKQLRHDSVLFNRLVPVLARLIHRYKTPQMILSELESIGCINLANTNRNPNPLLLLLRMFSRAGNYTMLIETCLHMVEFHGFAIFRNTFASNLVMESMFKTSQPERAFYIMENTKLPNFLTFNIALFHLSNLNDITSVSYVLRQMLRLRYRPNHATFSAVLNSFCKINAFRQVYQILGLMVGLEIEFSVNVWTVLIHKFCKLRRLDVASDLLYKMIRTGCSPNVVTYTALIKAFMESNMVTHALHLFNDMVSAGLDPDLVLSNVLIDCFLKSGMHDDAIEVFHLLSEQKNMKPDLYTLTSLLSIVCRSERFDLLPKIVRACRYIGGDLVFCNAVLSSFIKSGRSSRALEYYEHMIVKGFKPDKYSIAGLLSALCAERRIDEAVNVYRGSAMMYHANDALIHTVLTSGLINAGQYHLASIVFRSATVQKCPLDSEAYAAGIRAHLRSGLTLEANTLFDQMKNKGLEPNVQTFNMILFSSFKEKDLQKIKLLLKEMIDSRIELGDRNFFNLCKLQSSWNLLAEMRDLGLLSAKVLHTLSCGRHPESVKENYKHCAEVDKECNLVLDSSSSEYMSDVAVSVG